MSIDPNLDKIASDVDKSHYGNKNGEILDNDAEKKEFVRKAREAKIAEDAIREYFGSKNIDNKTVENIFGLVKSEDEASQAAIERTRALAPEVREIPDSAEAKAVMFIPVSSKEFIKNPSFLDLKEQMMAKANESFRSPEEKKFYNYAATVVQNHLLNKHMNTKDEIEKTYKEEKRKIEGESSTKEDRNFRLEVLKQLCAYVEASVMEKEFEKVKNRYVELKKSTLNNGTIISIDKAYDTVKNEFEKNGSYYPDALKRLKKTTLEDDAIKLRNEYRNKQKGTENEMANGFDSKLYDQSSRDIKKGIKKDMKADGVYTKTIKKIDRRHGMTTRELLNPYEKSREKGQDIRMAAYNKVETRKRIPYKKEEITNELKDKNLFAGLVNGNGTAGVKPLIEKKIDNTGNVTYNISELSDLITSFASKGDYTVNVSDDENYSEIENIANVLSARAGMKVSIEDTKNLIDLCGHPRDHKNVFYDIASGVGKGIENAVAPVATGLLVDAASTFDPKKKADFTGKMFKVDLNDYIKGDVNIEIDMSSYTTVNGERIDGNFHLKRSSETILNDQLDALKAKGYDADYITKPDGLFLYIKADSRDMGRLDGDLKDVIGEDYTFEDLGAKNDDPKVNREKAIAIGVGMSVLMGVISELMKPYKSEMSIINNYIAPNTTYNEFILKLDSMDIPAQAKEGFKALALEYVEKDENNNLMLYDEQGNRVNCDENGYIIGADGKPSEVRAIAKWSDRLGLIDRLHEIGGWYSKTNKHEGYGFGLNPAQFKLVKNEPPVVTPKEQVKVDEKPKDNLEGYHVNGTKGTLAYPWTHLDNGKTDSWTKIIEAFYDIDQIKADAKKAGIPYTVYFKKAVSYNKDGTFNAKLFSDLKRGVIPDYVNLPEKIGDCVRKRDEFDENTVEKLTPSGKQIGSVKLEPGAGGTKGHYGIKTTDAKGETKQDTVNDYNTKYPNKPKIKVEDVNWKD